MYIVYQHSGQEDLDPVEAADPGSVVGNSVGRIRVKDSLDSGWYSRFAPGERCRRWWGFPEGHAGGVSRSRGRVYWQRERRGP